MLEDDAVHERHQVAGGASASSAARRSSTAIRTTDHGWGAPVTLAGLGVVAVLAGAFTYRQRRAARPLIPAVAITRPHAIAYPVAILAASALFGMFFFMTLYMQQVLGWSALRTGLAWAPQGAAIAVVTRRTRRVHDRLPHRAGDRGGVPRRRRGHGPAPASGCTNPSP